jgi:hypothetical protein
MRIEMHSLSDRAMAEYAGKPRRLLWFEGG